MTSQFLPIFPFFARRSPPAFPVILKHLGTLTGLFLVPIFWKVSAFYFIGAGLAAALLIAEHVIALGNSVASVPDARHIRIASYSINEILPLVILAGTAAGIYTL